MGAGRNFNKRFSVEAEYSYNHFSVPQQIITDSFGTNGISGLGRIAGDVHIWSLTVDPSYHYFETERWGGYVVGGGGFYRKVTLFRQAPTNCPNGDCGPPTNNLLTLSNNAGGINVGTGISRRVSDASNAKLFVEGRYVWIDNQPSPNNRAYLPANYRTGYFPVTAGVRW